MTAIVQSAEGRAADLPWAVEALDHADSRACTVANFAMVEQAIAYARARTWDSVEEMRQPLQSREDLILLWRIYGERCIVPGSGWLVSDEMDHYFDHPASDVERQWET